jgi:Tol biopolymer transport system component/DNA-binding winged helix-turn-helix (wHTH) protein
MVTSRRAGWWYEFGPFRLDAAERVLRRGEQEIPLPPKVFETLLVLVEHSGHILEKDELMKTLWPDTFVEESSLAQNVFLLRKALGESGSSQRFIETIPRRGYRFVAEVRVGHENEAALTVRERAETRVIIEEEERASFPRWKVTASIAALALAALALAGAYAFRRSALAPGQSASAFQKMRITKLTTTGKAGRAAISPDGKYIAHVIEENGRQSIWVRQVAAPNGVPVVPSAEVEYEGLTFSRDGIYLAYVAYPLPKQLGTLYRVPILGGPPQKLIEDVDTAVSYAPDGRQMAFIRNHPQTGETVLLMAESDGTASRKLLSRTRPGFIALLAPAWSPDGKVIACVVGQTGTDGTTVNILGVRVNDGSHEMITSRKWGRLGQISWLGDGSGLVMAGRDRASPFPADQLWLLPYPDGAPRRITNDLNSYFGLSLSDDARALITTQSARVTRLWLVPDLQTARATQIASSPIDNNGERLGLSWTPEGRLLYSSYATGNPDLWVMNADGSAQQQLTVDPEADIMPAASPDGRQIVFSSNRSGAFRLWRIGADGADPQALTTGASDVFPSFTPDGRWVVYESYVGGKTRLWKVPTSGGTPQQVSELEAFRPTVSPDGRTIACYIIDPQAVRTKMSLVKLDDGQLLRHFDQQLTGPPILQWAPDGRALVYVETRNGTSNLWSQPIDGGPPAPLTAFKDQLIFRAAFSPDGHSLAVERGYYINDVVLISDFN